MLQMTKNIYIYEKYKYIPYWIILITNYKTRYIDNVYTLSQHAEVDALHHFCQTGSTCVWTTVFEWNDRSGNYRRIRF